MDWGALCGYAMRKQVCRGLEGNGPTALQGHGNCSLHHASSPYIWKKSLTSVCLVKYSQRCSSQNRASKFQICRVPKSKKIDHLKAQYVVWMILSWRQFRDSRGRNCSCLFLSVSKSWIQIFPLKRCLLCSRKRRTFLILGTETWHRDK